MNKMEDMNVKVPESIKLASRELRKNMTEFEKKLWKYLRYDKIGVRFLRQMPLYVYTENTGQNRFIIPDFYCHERKTIIEVDGGIHETPEVLNLDQIKQGLLEKMGIQVIRIKNEDIENNIDEVIAQIKNKLT